MKIQVAPSILSADFGKLAEDIKMVEQAGADMIHIDVMDGHFVPNLTYGPIIVKTCKKITSLPLDVHLMITNAEQCLDGYIDAGADYISIHQEAVYHLQRQLNYIRKAGVKAGVALNPATPVSSLEYVTADLDFVLIMTVNPGFEAQKFIPESLKKIQKTKQLLESKGSNAIIEVDGGISPKNAGEVTAAGASMLVAGSAIFKADSPSGVINELKKAGA